MPRKSSIKRDGGESESVKAEYVVIRPCPCSTLKAWPRYGKVIINSDDAVKLERVPKKLLVIGGGVIGLEFATVYGRSGRRGLGR